MPTSTTNLDYRPLHPFDSVYSIVFILLMYHLLGTTIVNIFVIDLPWEAKIYHILVTLFFFYQLSRMYYYLKNFEEIIIRKGNHHFLEILPNRFQTFEKIIRLFLAAVLVLFSKFQAQMNLLSVTLLLCFALLILWDLIVIAGLKSSIKNTNGHSEAKNDSLKTAKSFFYLLDEELRSSKRIYLFKTKFFERIFGFLASLTAFFFQSQNDGSNGIYILVFVFFVVLFVFTAYYGKIKIKELEISEIDEFIDDILRPFYLPIYKLIHNLIFFK